MALAVHVAFSERARRQAGSMLRGSVLAALAGTATMCAGLAFLNPSIQAGGGGGDDDDGDDSAEPPRTEPVVPTIEVAAAAAAAAAADRPSRVRVREDGSQGSRLTVYGAGLRRWIASLTPSAQRLVSVRSGVCVLASCLPEAAVRVLGVP